MAVVCFVGDYTVEALVLFINEKANEFVSVNGGLTAAGELIQRAEAQAFRSNGGGNTLSADGCCCCCGVRTCQG